MIFSEYILKLELNPQIASAYRSLSQRARVLTENWVQENLYCPACSSDELYHTPTGRQVVDFACPDCQEKYQLKSQSHPYGYRVMNSAYQPKIKAVRAGTAPNYLFLQYNMKLCNVSNLFLVPKYFMTESIIEKRKPLSEHARRHDWIGSNILLGNLATDARITIIRDGHEIPKNMVRYSWKRFSFLLGQSSLSRGWLADVLACTRKLDHETFTLDQVYKFEDHLAKLHPKNKHIRPKIRQQLQVLRDHNVITFLGKGMYKFRI